MTTSYQFTTSSIGGLEAVTASGNRVLAVWYNTTGGYGHLAIFNSLGITVLADTVIHAASTTGLACDELANGNIVVAYIDNADSSKGKFLIVNTSGVTQVAETVFEAGSTQDISAVALTNGNFLLSYRDFGDSNKGKFVIYDNTGAVVVAAMTFEVNATGTIRAKKLNNDNVVIAYKDTTDGDGNFVVYDQDGNLVVAKTQFESGTITLYARPSVLAGGEFVIAYRDTGDSNKGKYVVYTAAGVQQLAPTIFHDASTTNLSCCALDTTRIMFAFDGETSDDHKYVIYDSSGALKKDGTIFESGLLNTTAYVISFSTGDSAIVWGMTTGGYTTISDYGFIPPEGHATTKWLVAVANNEVWYGQTPTTMVELAAANGDIDISQQLMIFEAYGKAFFVNGTNFKVADFQNTKITTTNIGTNPPDRGNILTEADGAQMVVDYITNDTPNAACTIYGFRTTAAKFQNAHAVTGKDNDDLTISFTTSAAETAPSPPHWYDWTPYGNAAKSALKTTYGTMPTKAYVGCLSGGRCMTSGNPDYPHQVPGSAAGNPWDWNIYRATSDRSVVIGSGVAGQIGDVVRAVIPARDGQLIIGCANSMHILNGNPADGGQMIDVGGDGIFNHISWCFDGKGNLYWWGTNGIYRLTKDTNQVKNINISSMPSLIGDTGANPATHRITVGYDLVRIGIKICITLLADGTSSNYWLDLQMSDPSKGLYAFFPDSHAATHGIYSQFQYDANDPANKGLLLGCKDGYLRVHSDTTANDDSTAIDSYVCFGPLPLAEDGRDGSLEAFDVILAGGASGGSETDSNDVTLKVWTEDVAETVIEDLEAGTSPKLVMTFTGPGRRHGGKKRRGVRGAYAGLKIGNDTVDQTFGFEKIILDSGAPGRRLR